MNLSAAFVTESVTLIRPSHRLAILSPLCNSPRCAFSSMFGQPFLSQTPKPHTKTPSHPKRHCPLVQNCFHLVVYVAAWKRDPKEPKGTKSEATKRAGGGAGGEERKKMRRRTRRRRRWRRSLLPRATVGQGAKRKAARVMVAARASACT